MNRPAQVGRVLEGWEKSLHEFLFGASKIAVLGVGNPMRGGDGAGSHVADLIGRYLSLTGARISIPVLPVAGGAAPENYTGIIRKFEPTHVVMIDAYAQGAEVGHIEMIPEECLKGLSLSSHTMPLGILVDYFIYEGFSRIFCLGVEPGTVEFASKMPLPVRLASRKIARRILADCS